MPYRHPKSFILKPPLGTPINTGDPLAKSLVGAWSLGEGGGLKTFDMSGRGNTGTLTNGPTWVPGRRGRALKFIKASSQYVNLGLPPILNLGGPFTLSVWINPISLPGAPSTTSYGIIVKGYDGTSTAYQLDFQNDSSTGNLPGLIVAGYVSGTSYGTYWNYGSNIVTGKWYHVAGICDGAFWRLYVNGLQVAATASTHLPVGNTKPVSIGFADFGADGYFDGIIEDARIYSRALHAREIAALYSEPSRPFIAQRRRIISGLPSTIIYFDMGYASESNDSVQVDALASTERSGAIRQDTATTIETSVAVRSDATALVETSSTARQDAPVAVEAASAVRFDTTTMLAYSATIKADAQAALEWIGSTTIIYADAQMRVEWLSQMRGDGTTALEQTAGVYADTPFRPAWLAAVQTDIPAPIAITAGIVASYTAPIEWLQISGNQIIISDYRMAMDWNTTVRTDALGPIEWRTPTAKFIAAAQEYITYAFPITRASKAFPIIRATIALPIIRTTRAQ